MAQIMTLIPRISILIIALASIMTSTGCSKPSIVDGNAIVNLDGTDYTLKIVADNDTRTIGLGGVTHLDETEGMIFVFPKSQIRAFVMRDCVIDIDIIYLDPTGRIVAMHHMPVEPPKTPEESPLDYERRLKKYPSRFAAQYAIEIKGGKLKTMNLKEGQVINLDTDYFTSIAR